MGKIILRLDRVMADRKVSLKEDFHETLLTVADEKADLLPDRFEGTVETVYDCIVAYEAENAHQEARV